MPSDSGQAKLERAPRPGGGAEPIQRIGDEGLRRVGPRVRDGGDVPDIVVAVEQIERACPAGRKDVPGAIGLVREPASAAVEQGFGGRDLDP